MFRQVLGKLQGEVSGEIALSHVAEISRHHRIQVSPGIRDAINYAADTLRWYGLDVEIRRYKSDGEVLAWSSPMFKEWSCSSAELRLIAPKAETRFLSRYIENKMSIIQRSPPTPKDGIEAEVVVLEKGEDVKEYKGLDLKGKVVLTNGEVGRVRELAIERHGAIGIIYDGMWVREPNLKEGELDDALKYTSFWWYGGEKTCWGFVLTPRTGRWLRRLIEKSTEPVKIHAVVNSRLYVGEMENCIAKIPGETEEMVIVVAHICHPQPSANDNASGIGAAMETARVLQRLIALGTLPKPRRSIVFTLVPEISGTYPWLAENEARITDMVAAINLDMVGEKQDLCGGPLIMEMTPESCPSYVNSLIESVYDAVKAEAKNLGGSASYPLFKHAVTPFSGGSDHYIYSDPTVGVPCPMIIQWPDKFYHTSLDTIDKVDPEMLRKVALITATYAYFIANAGTGEAIWLATEVASREKRALLQKLQMIVDEAAEADCERAGEIYAGVKEKVDYWTERSTLAITSVSQLSPKDKKLAEIVQTLKDDFLDTAKVQRKRTEAAFKQVVASRSLEFKPKRRRHTKLEREASGIVPRRIYRGPISTRQWTKKLSPEDKEGLYQLSKDHRDSSNLGTLAVYWANGDRSLLEISRLVELEAGRTNLDYLYTYFRYLEKMGLIELR